MIAQVQEWHVKQRSHTYDRTRPKSDTAVGGHTPMISQDPSVANGGHTPIIAPRPPVRAWVIRQSCIGVSMLKKIN